MNDHIKNVCKIGQGHECCRYLVVGPRGFECEKGTSMGDVLDLRVIAETITARGDNCEGKPANELNSK